MSSHHDDLLGGHPVARFVAVLEAELADLADAQTWSLGSELTAGLIPRISGVLAGVQELEARVIRHAEDIGLPASIGARSTTQWLARVTRVTGGEASRKVRLATSLDAHEPVRTAMATGHLYAEQAK